jgi:hypothetical protein
MAACFLRTKVLDDDVLFQAVAVWRTNEPGALKGTDAHRRNSPSVRPRGEDDEVFLDAQAIRAIHETALPGVGGR